jgi:hypothetical protein
MAFSSPSAITSRQQDPGSPGDISCGVLNLLNKPRQIVPHLFARVAVHRNRCPHLSIGIPIGIKDRHAQSPQIRVRLTVRNRVALLSHQFQLRQESLLGDDGPGAADYYRRNKKFADGTVLVKEVFGTDHAQMTTGDAHWANDTKVWFVLIKDSKGRYPNNPLWGDGWGWVLFKSDAPNKQVATDYKKDCLGCHIPAKVDDWIYVKGYPVLHGK